MLVATLAVRKAGAACATRDPTYSQERLNYMIEDSRTPVLLTQGHLRGSTDAKTDAKTDALKPVRTLSGAKALDTGTDLSGEKVGTRFSASVEGGGTKVICIDHGWNADLTGNEKNPASAVQPDNLIYMI